MASSWRFRLAIAALATGSWQVAADEDADHVRRAMDVDDQCAAGDRECALNAIQIKKLALGQTEDEQALPHIYSECTKAKRCAGKHIKCFAQNDFFAQCLESCPNANWTCNILDAGASEASETSSDAAAATTENSGCEITASAQSDEFLHDWCKDVPEEKRYPACYPIGVPGWKPQGNVIVKLPNPAACTIAVSPSWTVAGWSWQYVQLAPGAVFQTPTMDDDKKMFMKMMRGTVLDVNENGVLNSEGHWETFVVTPPLTQRNMEVSSSVKEIKAGAEGAVFAFMTVSDSLLKTPITSMFESPTTTVSGPHSNLLEWTRYGKYYKKFVGVEFWNLAGIKVDDHEGNHLLYNQWWTAREDYRVDGGYHNEHDGSFHNSTFGELHMVMYSAAPNVGLIVQLPHTVNTDTIPRPEVIPGVTAERPLGDEYLWFQRGNKYVQLDLPLPPGYAHGPVWSVNKSTGGPTFDCRGAVRYPWHGLVTGPVNAQQVYPNPPRYTLWVAFEHPLKDITIPTAMLQYVQNAYNTYDVDWPTEECGGTVSGKGA